MGSLSEGIKLLDSSALVPSGMREAAINPSSPLLRLRGNKYTVRPFILDAEQTSATFLPAAPPRSPYWWRMYCC